MICATLESSLYGMPLCYIGLLYKHIDTVACSAGYYHWPLTATILRGFFYELIFVLHWIAFPVALFIMCHYLWHIINNAIWKSIQCKTKWDSSLYCQAYFTLLQTIYKIFHLTFWQNSNFYIAVPLPFRAHLCCMLLLFHYRILHPLSYLCGARRRWEEKLAACIFEGLGARLE